MQSLEQCLLALNIMSTVEQMPAYKIGCTWTGLHFISGMIP